MTQHDIQPHAPQSLGARIAHARRLLGVREGVDLLVPDLAKRAGITAASLYNWEADEAVPGEANLQRLCAVLRVTPAYLRYGVGEPTPSGPPDLAQIMAGARKLTSEEIARAETVAARVERHTAKKAPARKKRGGE